MHFSSLLVQRRSFVNREIYSKYPHYCGQLRTGPVCRAYARGLRPSTGRDNGLRLHGKMPDIAVCCQHSRSTELVFAGLIRQKKRPNDPWLSKTKCYRTARTAKFEAFITGLSLIDGFWWANIVIQGVAHLIFL